MRILTLPACLVLTAAAFAAHAETPNPAPTVAQLMARTPEANGIFTAADDGTAHHIQSGLICPASFPNLNIWHLEIFAADGTDVGCDYGRNGPDNQAMSKLTIYATKAQPGDTVDAAFGRYQAEIASNYPGATSKGPAITLGGGSFSPEIQAMRSAKYDLTLNGHAAQSQLVVAMKAGWVIEIRATTVTEVGDVDQAAKAVGDEALPFVALTQALDSVGTTPADKPASPQP